jgi:hypothetical protein
MYTTTATRTTPLSNSNVDNTTNHNKEPLWKTVLTENITIQDKVNNCSGNQRWWTIFHKIYIQIEVQ